MALGGDDPAFDDNVAACRISSCADAGGRAVVVRFERTAAERRIAGDVDGLADRERLAFRDVDAGILLVKAPDAVLAVNSYFRIAETCEARPIIG